MDARYYIYAVIVVLWIVGLIVSVLYLRALYLRKCSGGLRTDHPDERLAMIRARQKLAEDEEDGGC